MRRPLALLLLAALPAGCGGGDEPHGHVFAVYATDSSLGLGEDSSPNEVRSALSDHALARGTLTGRFGR